MDYFFLFIGAVILIFALMLFMKFKKMQQKSVADNSFRTQKTESGSIDFVRCPLCSTPLAKNEDMFSRIYRPMTTPDQRMTVHGCPHCYPRPEPGVKRKCPVCGKYMVRHRTQNGLMFKRCSDPECKSQYRKTDNGGEK